MVMKAVIHALAFMLIIVFFLNMAGLEAQQVTGGSVELRVFEDGYVYVQYRVEVANVSLLKLPLIGVPDENLVIIVVDENGYPLAYDINETTGTFDIIALGAKRVEVSYYTQTITSKEGETWSIRLVAPFETKVTLPPNSVITKISPLPLTVDAVNDQPVVTFRQGQLEVQYMILKPAPAVQPNETKTPSGEPGAQPQQPGSHQPSGKNEEKKPGGEGKPGEGVSQKTNDYWNYLLLGVAAIATGVGIVAVMKLRGRKFEELSEEDKLILKAIERLGGEAFQSDIQRIVGLPSTTLWRRIRKLEKLGYVTIEKRYGRNYIVLK